MRKFMSNMPGRQNSTLRLCSGQEFWKDFFIFFILFVIALPMTISVVRITEPGVLIVKVESLESAQKLSFYAEKIEPLYDQVYRLRVVNKDLALKQLRTLPEVVFAEEDGVLRTSLVASDPLFVLDTAELKRQWYLPKMKVHEAWEKTRGSGVTIAIVDTGIDAKHEDLNDGRVVRGYLSYCQVPSQAVPNECLVRNTGEVAPGINSDDNGHGTIVAGIIGGIANNGKGIAGINWNVRLMPIKAMDSTGTGLASDVALGIRWAADNGAKIINLSVGGAGIVGAEILQDAISYAFKKGVLIVAAAGNDAAVTGGDLDTDPVSPVCLDGGENMVVGVAAVDISDKKARFSNYGSNCIDIAAPGTGTFIDKQQKQGIVSVYYDPTQPGEQDLYVYAVGTSVAAPMVSGVAGLMMSVFPDLDIKAIRDRLIAAVDNIDQINDTGCNGQSCQGQIGRGRLNALKAVTSFLPLSGGTLIKDPQGQMYLIERGLKRPISDFVLRQRFIGVSIVNATNEQVATYPIGLAVPPVDGSLIKEPDVPTVYLAEGGERRGLSYLAFISRGFRFESVVTLPAGEVRSYPLGSLAPVLSGALMKALDHPAVYILQNGQRQLLSYFVFIQRGFSSQPLAILSFEELANYPFNPQGFLYPPIEGTLIRGTEVATVYLIEQGKRRGLNYQAFVNRGYSFENVKVLPQSEIGGYEVGGDILQ